MTLTELRKAHSMSQNDLAQAIEVTPTTIYKWEAGKARPLPQHVRALAELYRVPITEIQAAILASAEPTNQTA